MIYRDDHYKDAAIEYALDWIKGHYHDLLDFTDDKDEKLNFLQKVIIELFSKHIASTDQQEACYRCANRAIQEALDKPLSELTPLLREARDSQTGHVKRRLYYPEAGYETKEKDEQP